MIPAFELRKIFEDQFNSDTWRDVLVEVFGLKNYHIKPQKIGVTPNNWNAKGFELGNFETLEGRLVGAFKVEINERVKLQYNKVGLRKLLEPIFKEAVDAALIVFVQGDRWRFTYVSEISVTDTSTGKRIKKATDPKRFTYLFGKGEKGRTASERFSSIRKSKDLFAEGITLTALEDAFSVELMSNAFFDEYRALYGKFIVFLTGENESGKIVQTASPLLKTMFKNDKKDARDFVKKMLGRIVFLYFLQKKGWLGATDTEWKNGDQSFISNLFNDTKRKGDFYSDILVLLFFRTLNRKRPNNYFEIENNLFTKGNYNRMKVPYLNGGLFEEDPIEEQALNFPKELFEELFKFFDRYNFTVYEDSPDEQTVAVDPEMLGHIFENLLEDNRDKGSYYTPKEVVHYMCQESLVEYLYARLNPKVNESYQELGKSQTDLFGNKGKVGQLSIVKKNKVHKEVLSREILNRFIKQGEVGDILNYEEAILTALYTVKVCDPAIGSGAFPMGVLMEIFHALETMYEATAAVTKKVWQLKGADWESNRAAVKLNIIQKSIYGVDLEQGAVDIARLRFWLSLVVDEDEPKTLPNLDYKIMQGNSLLESFEDVDLSVVPRETDLGFDDDKSFSKKDVKRLKELAQQYFTIQDRKQKKDTHTEIDRIVHGYIKKTFNIKLKKVDEEIDKATKLLAMLNKERPTIPVKQRLKENSLKEQNKILEDKIKERETMSEIDYDIFNWR